MPKTNPDTIYYDLSTSQSVAYRLFKYCLHKECMNIAVCLYLKRKLDFDLFKKSFNIEIERNDCLRLFYKKKAGKIRQYFTNPYEMKEILVVDFTDKTKAVQDAFFSKDASKPVRFLKNKIFRIKLIKTFDDRCGIYFNVCHLNMDAMSVFLFFNDLMKVYTALLDDTDMPKPFNPFTEYMERKKQYFENKEKVAKDEQFFRDLYLTNGEPLYCGANGIKPLDELRKKRRNPNLRSFPIVNLFQDKTKNIKLHLSEELSGQIERYCADNKTTPFCIIQLAMRIFLSKVNNGAEDILYLTVCNKLATLADKNTSGSLAEGVNIRTIIGADTKFNDAITRTGEALSQSFRHANYDSGKSTALLSSFYKKGIFDQYTSMVISFISVLALDGWEYEAEWISNGRFAMHLYVIIIQNPSDGRYDIYYEYRVKILNKENIETMHNDTIKIIKLGLDNPEMSIGDIIKQTDN